MSISTLFAAPKPLIGMVHLAPLPGAPRWGGSLDAVLERALADARVLEAAGLDGVVVENYCDVPFYPESVPAETVAAMSVCVREVVKAISVPVGVNLLRNDGPGAMAIAAVTGARFVRINVHTGVAAADQGILTGRAYETVRLRQRLGAEVAIFADVWVKHATPFPGAELEQAAEDAFHRGLADALIVTGSGTGKATDLSRVERVKQVVPEAPVFIGSGLTSASGANALSIADGAIVGSSICRGGVAGAGIDAERARELIRTCRAQP